MLPTCNSVTRRVLCMKMRTSITLLYNCQHSTLSLHCNLDFRLPLCHTITIGFRRLSRVETTDPEASRLHWAGEGFLAVHNGSSEITRPRDELFEEVVDRFYKRKDRFKRLRCCQWVVRKQSRQPTTVCKRVASSKQRTARKRNTNRASANCEAR
jgi:hypothetical protein